MKKRTKRGFAWLVCMIFVCLTAVQPVYAAEPDVEAQAQQAATQSVLSLNYDDRYSIANDYPGYTIDTVWSQFVTSYQVQNGQISNIKDENVLVKTSDTTLTATGVGAATVVLKKGSGWSTQYVNLYITVKPARLTMMYLLGQSNMEGMCSGNTGYENDKNILNTAGAVYSTYLPTATDPSNYMTDIFWSQYGTKDNAWSFVPQSLTSTYSLAGTQLQYPLNVLTTEVQPYKGKGGMDSALAYEWRQKTGDKVWVVNLAYSGSRIYQWVPGNEIYERAAVTAQLVKQVYDAEIAVGHYTTGNQLAFWMQGELDSMTVQAADYRQYFLNMYQNFSSRVPVEKCGIITTRAAVYTHKYVDDVYLCGPRIAQYGLGASPELTGIYVVCNAHEQWITDEGVAQYFQNRFPYGVFTYPMRSTDHALPTSIYDVHQDIHFSQTGHNENAIIAADNMYALVYGSSVGVQSFQWRDVEYQAISQVTLRKNTDMVVLGLIDPVYLSKQISYTMTDGLSYDVRTATLRANTEQAGDQYLDARLSDGTFLGRLTVHVVDHYDYEDASGRPYTGLYQQADGQWIYVKNGSWAPDYTGFVQKDNDWWYVENGRITFTCYGLVKGLANGSNSWWYVTGSRISFCSTVAENAYGWWKITNGQVDFNFTGLAENAYGWWKITNGQVDFSYVGYEQNGSNWWYVYGGQVCFQTTDVLQGTVGGQYGWWKVCEGKVNFDDDVCENAYGWWKITCGKVDFDYNGLAQNAYGWWMIQQGHVNFSANGLVDNGNGWWLVRNGMVDFSYNGLIDNGNGWWLITNGQVNFAYQGYVQNEYGIWWVSGGHVDFSHM